MRFAVTSQNFRTITGHAGKARRFLLFEASGPADIRASGRLDLPIEMAFHGFDDRLPHPLDGVEVLITAGAGEGFVQRLARRGIRVIRTATSDPVAAVRGFFDGTLAPPLQHDQDHAHTPDAPSGCGCQHGQ